MSEPTDRTQQWRRRRSDAIAVGAATLVVAGTALVATNGVSAIEASLFHAVNDLPNWLYRPLWLAQYLGLLLLPLAVAVVAAALRRWRLAAALVLLVPLKLIIEKGLLKEVIYRARPGTSVCGRDPSCLNLRGDVPALLQAPGPLSARIAP